MDRLEAMSILLLTVEKGSFSAAARELRIPLPTVSRKVSELEAHLGTPLLIRTTRRLTLTDAGTAYVAAAKRILEEVNEAERMAAGNSSRPEASLS
jgi:DNA-binding transcriptional LysR family regulator